VNLIIPFRDIMVVEKPAENSNLPDIETQSTLLITTKERVKYLIDVEIFLDFGFIIRLEHLFFQILLIENLFLINYQFYYHNIMKQYFQISMYQQ
jgi:hypothetical protein